MSGALSGQVYDRLKLLLDYLRLYIGVRAIQCCEHGAGSKTRENAKNRQHWP